MTTDRPPDSPPDSPDADPLGPWMSGLAGRPGTGADHRDGARLRTALAPDARDKVKATWLDIEARARDAAPSDPGSATTVAAPSGGSPSPTAAANDPQPARRWLGWAAALVLGVGLVALLSPPGWIADPGMRGVNGGGLQGPRWLVDDPSVSADALATELRGLRAEVTVTREGPAVVLNIRADRAAAQAVNARLMALETGLDAEGRLRLVVLPNR